MLQVRQPEGMVERGVWIKCGEFASAARSWQVGELAGSIGFIPVGR